MNDNYLFSDQPEENFILNSNYETRKKYGQFFTPFEVADFMVSWVINQRKNITILDPSFGLGIFARAAFQREKKLNFIGYDLETNILKEAQKLFKNNQDNFNLNLCHQDYLLQDFNIQYDGIICNPPYLKFQDFDQNKSILKNFHQKTAIKLSGFSNIYILFLIKSLIQLNQNGRLAYLIPSEFLNANYGQQVKQFLIENQTLKYIIVFDNNQNLFSQVLTTSSILLCANDHKKVPLTFIKIKDHQELIKLQRELDHNSKNILGETFNYTELKPEVKWRIYYQGIATDKYKNLVPFTNYAQVKRGIATGANDYFIFNKTKQKQFKIPDKYLLPCITKSHQAKTEIFTQDHLLNLLETDGNILLLNILDTHNENVVKYLELGLKLGIDQKYLTHHRKPWYKIENRPPAPFWIGVFNRQKIKFIKNEANILNLTAFHCIYPKEIIQDKINIFFAYLLTNIAQEIFNYNHREYGAGLNKFEPNDLNKSQIINFEIIDTNTINQIEILYQNYRLNLLSGIVDQSILNHLNEIFLQFLS
jgi:adenine-specific DNA-methyltransferase